MKLSLFMFFLRNPWKIFQSSGILNSFVVEKWIAYTDQNYVSTVGKNLLKSQKNDIITGRCSNFIFLKLNVLPTGIVPRSFVTDDFFLTTCKKEMGNSENDWPTLSLCDIAKHELQDASYRLPVTS